MSCDQHFNAVFCGTDRHVVDNLTYAEGKEAEGIILNKRIGMLLGS